MQISAPYPFNRLICAPAYLDPCLGPATNPTSRPPIKSIPSKELCHKSPYTPSLIT